MKQSAGIIVKVKDKCLVCQRAQENEEPGKWAIPMGGIEEGEDPKEAAYREFIEEMGVDIDGDIESYGKINRYNKLGVQKSVLHVFTYETNQKIVKYRRSKLLKSGHLAFQILCCNYLF
jgi:ADP-ribose pyrophosphatase YjhB (NUDIX family)